MLAEKTFHQIDPRWERYRSMIRRVLVSGDVSLRDGGYDVVSRAARVGLDSDARCRFWSVLMALRLIKAKDREAHMLLVRDIGRPCRRGHVERGHCHRVPISELPALAGYEYGELEERTAKAVAWLLSLVD
jgi:hypothetical protein